LFPFKASEYNCVLLLRYSNSRAPITTAPSSLAYTWHRFQRRWRGGRVVQVSGRSLALQQAVDAAIVGELAASKPQEDSDASGRSADLSIAVDSFPQKLSSSFLLMLGVPSVVPWLGPTFCCIGFATQVLFFFCFFRCVFSQVTRRLSFGGEHALAM